MRARSLEPGPLAAREVIRNLRGLLAALLAGALVTDERVERRAPLLDLQRLDPLEDPEFCNVERVALGLGLAVKRANERLAEAGRAPLPKLTPHSLRRTSCSLLYALGETLPVQWPGWGTPIPGSHSRSMLRRCVAMSTRLPSSAPR